MAIKVVLNRSNICVGRIVKSDYADEEAITTAHWRPVCLRSGRMDEVAVWQILLQKPKIEEARNLAKIDS